MKKALLLIVFALLCSGIVNADITASPNKSTDKYSHWSIMVSGGFNMLICERTNGWIEHEWVGHDNYGEGIMGNYRDNFSPAGLFQADYMVSPQFGFRLQYLYNPINREAIYTGDKTIFSDKDGQSHQATVQLTVNLLNIFYRCRKDTKFNWYAGVGVGAMFFKIPTFEEYRPIVCIPLATSLEYSPIKSMAVVLHAELDWYGDDEVNGVDLDDQVNDMGLYVGLGLRYHINAVKKKHVRNSDMCNMDKRSNKSKKSDDDDDEDDTVTEKDTDKKDLEELQDQMNELEKRNRELSDKIELMNRDIMERMDKYFTDKPDTDDNQDVKSNEGSGNDNSGKKNIKENDNSKNNNKGNGNGNAGSKKNSSSSSKSNSNITSVEKNKTEYTRPADSNITSVEGPNDASRNSKGDRKQEEIYYEAMMSNGTEANEVIFDIESSRVKSKFELKIATVAKRMLANKKLQLDIFSYLKKEERTRENVELATKRMEAVYYILVNRYLIDQNRIKYDILEPAEDDSSADIRCDMVYR